MRARRSKTARDPNQNQPPPRSERNKEAGESSSRDTRIDLSPPKNDAKDHPNSTVPEDDSGRGCFRLTCRSSTPSIRIGPRKTSRSEIFISRRRITGAALERYREALFYKPNDAVANFRMAQAFEKLAQSDDAVEHYQEYLKILPNGPLREEAKKALEKLKAVGLRKDQAKQ